LQQYLNNHGFIVAEGGPGSPGNETEKFGWGTQNAVRQWQEANGVSPASGYFGSVSREQYFKLTAPFAMGSIGSNQQTSDSTQFNAVPPLLLPWVEPLPPSVSKQSQKDFDAINNRITNLKQQEDDIQTLYSASDGNNSQVPLLVSEIKANASALEQAKTDYRGGDIPAAKSEINKVDANQDAILQQTVSGYYALRGPLLLKAAIGETAYRLYVLDRNLLKLGCFLEGGPIAGKYCGVINDVFGPLVDRAAVDEHAPGNDVNKIATGLAVDLFFSAVPFSELNGKTIADAMSDREMELIKNAEQNIINKVASDPQTRKILTDQLRSNLSKKLITLRIDYTNDDLETVVAETMDQMVEKAQEHVSYTPNNQYPNDESTPFIATQPPMLSGMVGQSASAESALSQICTPQWATGSWGECTNGQQTRTVSDANGCNVTTGRPADTQSCAMPNPKPGAFELSIDPATCNKQTNEPNLHLHWTPSSGATSYTISRPGGSMPTVSSSWQTFDVTVNLVPGESYVYTIVAHNAAGDTDSNPSTVTVPANICSNTTGSITPPSQPVSSPTQSQTSTGSTQSCTPNWSCTGFGACANGQQTRTCTDTNNCGTTQNEPSATQVCTVPSPVPISQVIVSGNASLIVGQTEQLNVAISPANANYNGINWSSSNPAAVTVDTNGEVTAVAQGSSIITAIPATNVDTTGGSISITVKAAAVASSSGPASQGSAVTYASHPAIEINNLQFTLGTPVTDTSFSVTWGISPYTWTISGLPPGMYNDGAAILGTPTESGEFTNKINVLVQDSAGIMAHQLFTFDVRCRQTPSGPNCIQ
jgi:peptidoglycan hydrolase-like protein with peptidoglycan-binding domain